MNQNIWGPHFWITLHTLTFNYPLNPSHSDKHNYHTFFTILKDILPCSVCRRHFNRKLKEDPLKHHLNSRREIVEWMIDCHNKVNADGSTENFDFRTEAERLAEEQEAINYDNLKASAKAKLKSGQPLTEEEANFLML